MSPRARRLRRRRREGDRARQAEPPPRHGPPSQPGGAGLRRAHATAHRAQRRAAKSLFAPSVFPLTSRIEHTQSEASDHIPKDVLEAFFAFDRNGTGQLDYREVHSALEMMGLEASYAHAMEILDRYDANSSRTLEVRIPIAYVPYRTKHLMRRQTRRAHCAPPAGLSHDLTLPPRSPHDDPRSPHRLSSLQR